MPHHVPFWVEIHRHVNGFDDSVFVPSTFNGTANAHQSGAPPDDGRIVAPAGETVQVGLFPTVPAVLDPFAVPEGHRLAGVELSRAQEAGGVQVLAHLSIGSVLEKAGGGELLRPQLCQVGDVRVEEEGRGAVLNADGVVQQ